eukprot:81269-Rhodomonas_salina.2
MCAGCSILAMCCLSPYHSQHVVSVSTCCLPPMDVPTGRRALPSARPPSASPTRSPQPSAAPPTPPPCQMSAPNTSHTAFARQTRGTCRGWRHLDVLLSAIRVKERTPSGIDNSDVSPRHFAPTAWIDVVMIPDVDSHGVDGKVAPEEVFFQRLSKLHCFRPPARTHNLDVSLRKRRASAWSGATCRPDSLRLRAAL